MNKSFELFNAESKVFVNENDFINNFYNYWINYSLDHKLAWCFEKGVGLKDHHEKTSFKEEMVKKITKQFKEELSALKFSNLNDNSKLKEISSLKEVAIKIKGLRSKKKRLRKKFEKKLNLN